MTASDFDLLLQRLASLRERTLSTTHRPSAEEIAADLTQLEADLVALRERAATTPPPPAVAPALDADDGDDLPAVIDFADRELGDDRPAKSAARARRQPKRK